MDLATTVLGFVAGTLTTLAFLPQVIHTWRTKSTKDLSLRCCRHSPVACWFVYGLWIDSMPITLTNGVTFILAGTNLILKMRYG